MDEIKAKYNPLEVARILGEPLDPRKPYTDVVNLVCETDTADPDEYLYYHQVLNETNQVYTITANGNVTTLNVTTQDPTAFTFIDVATNEFYVKITDLAKAKESVLKRKLKTIDISLNMYENKYIFDLASASTATSGFANTLTSGQMRYSYNDLITQLENVIDYGDNYKLFVGSTIDKDIMLWNWNDNKFQSLSEAFKDLGIEKVRMGVGNLTIDSNAATRQLSAVTAYLIANSTVMGKPFLFVRKRLSDIDLLGAAIKQNGDKPERLVFVSPNPITVAGGNRFLAVGLTGYEEIVAACTNPYAVSKFTRA